MLMHTALPTNTLSHAWNTQAAPYPHLPLPPLIRTPEQRYRCRRAIGGSNTVGTRLHLYAGGDKDINIDDVLKEAEFALQAAETSLSSPKKEQAKKKMSSPEILSRSLDAVAGTMGGVVLGGILGATAFLQFPDLDLLISPYILPILFSFVLGTLGFASGFATTPTAAAIQAVLASPMKAILSILGLLALQQVEKGAQEVKAIPSRVANSVTQKVEQVSNDIQSFPSRAVTATRDKVLEFQKETKESLEKNANLVIGVTLAAVAVPAVLWVLSNSEQLGLVQ